MLDVLDGVPQFQVEKSVIETGILFGDLLTDKTTILASKGEYKRAMQENSLSMNKEKVSDAEKMINSEYLINGKFILIQRGKKNYFLIIAQ